MNGMDSIARLLITMGILILLLGVGFWLMSKLGGGGYRIPSDFVIRRGNFTLYFPLDSGIILSIIVTVLLNLFLRR